MSYTSYRPPCKKTKRAETNALSKKKGKPPTVMATPGANARVYCSIFDNFCKDF